MNEFLFVVTENNGDVAMFLMTNKNDIFINEEARRKLHEFWNEKSVYKHNIDLLLPVMAEELESGSLSVYGVKNV